MIHYRDMTFCNAYDRTCSNRDCSRAMTEAEHFKANRWAEKSGLKDTPVSYADMSHECAAIMPVVSKPQPVEQSR